MPVRRLPPGAGEAAAQAALEECAALGVPLLLPGLVQGWPACAKWGGPRGLQHLRGLVGRTTPVHVMTSSSCVFFGDLAAGYEPAVISFHTFLDAAEQAAQGSQDAPHLYLAQQELARDAGLGALLDDVRVPECISSRPISSTNLWMCIRGSRGNIHTDHYTNLLCVCTGTKRVTLFSPDETPHLYPAPVTADSSNHSKVNFASPDFQAHPLYRLALEQRMEVTLEAGDALLIPEGFWHQVDSTGITVAVNFWWPSALRAALAGQRHCAFYALRAAMGEALGRMVERLVEAAPPADLAAGGAAAGAGPAGLTGREAGAVALLCRALQGGAGGAGGEGAPTGAGEPAAGGAQGTPLQLPSDPLARVFRALTAAELVRVLWEVAGGQPQLVRAMFARLTPLAAHLLTSGLEAAERERVFSGPGGGEGDKGESGEGGQAGSPGTAAGGSGLCAEEFYVRLYSAAGDADQVFRQLLVLRQELARQAAGLLQEFVLRL